MATLIIKPGGGGDYTSLTAGLAAATSVDWLDLQGNSTESLYWNKNIAGIISTNGSVLTSTNNSPAIQFGGGITQQVQINDLKIDKQSGNAGAVSCFSLGSGGQVRFNRCEIVSTPSTGFYVVRFSDSFATDAIKFNKCIIHGENTDAEQCFWLSAATNTTAFELIDCEIYGAKFRGVYQPEDTANKVLKMSGCLIADISNGSGLDIASGSDIKNCTFANNSQDLNLTSFASVNDITYSGFEEADELLGTTNLCKNQGNEINPTNEFKNAAINDYRLKTGATLINAGTSIAGIIDDINGIIRPQGDGVDIGPHEAPIEVQVIMF